MVRNYRYVRFKTTQGIGHALFLLEWDRDHKEDTGQLVGSLTAAFCNPNDTFLKARAREMVDVRFEEGRLGRVVEFSVPSTKSCVISGQDFSVLLDSVMNEVVLTHTEEKDFAPNWARRAFNKKMVKFGLTVSKKKSV